MFKLILYVGPALLLVTAYIAVATDSDSPLGSAPSPSWPVKDLVDLKALHHEHIMVFSIAVALAFLYFKKLPTQDIVLIMAGMVVTLWMLSLVVTTSG